MTTWPLAPAGSYAGGRVNPLDEPKGEEDEEPVEEGLGEMKLLINPGLDSTEEVVAKRKMSQRVRNRIIKLRAKQSVARNRVEKCQQKQAVCWRAFRTDEVVPSIGCRGLGEGHTCFALGPIIFCKICGGTKS